LASSRKSLVKKQSEKTLHYKCQQWLEQSGIWNRLLIFHVPNERRGGIGAGLHFKRMGVRPGVADYLFFTPERAVAIELKDADGKLSEEQEMFRHRWEACSNYYFLCRTLEQFQGTINAFGPHR
jgi:hypothetical protein